MLRRARERGLDHGGQQGARHEFNNGFCTRIGSAHFTAFATTTSADMRERALAAHARHIGLMDSRAKEAIAEGRLNK